MHQTRYRHCPASLCIIYVYLYIDIYILLCFIYIYYDHIIHKYTADEVSGLYDFDHSIASAVCACHTHVYAKHILINQRPGLLAIATIESTLGLSSS
jgi:hypothetical protein